MDNAKLFRACKTGDLALVRELFNSKEIEFNIRDRWDSSPLYYACLCGHQEVVRFLLDNGAICDANTFDGERCVYGALTKSIRNMLVKDYKVVTRKVIQRRDFDEFLRKAFDHGEFSDIILTIPDSSDSYRLHRCVLASRCPPLGAKLRRRWKNRTIVKLTNAQLSSQAFKVLLRYLYNGILDFPIELKDQVIRILRQCGFEKQIRDIEEAIKNNRKRKSKKHFIVIEEEVNRDLEQLFRNSVIGQNSGSGDDDTEEDNDEDDDDQDDEDNRNRKSADYDIIFTVGKAQFFCHRLFICGRSDYFRALLENHFREASRTDSGVLIYELHTVTEQLFEAFLRFLYTDNTTLTFENVFDLLFLSDQYLVPSFKRYCAAFIEENIDAFAPIELITVARSMLLPKLEQTSIQYVAEHLEEFLDDDAFRKLVVEDAEAIRNRQETDSIDIIDDVRYYLSVSKLPNVDDLYSKINTFLDSLGLSTF